MRILLVSPYFPPLNAVAARRTYSFARTWSDAGHRVTVLTTQKRDDQRTLPRNVDGICVQEIAFRVPAPLHQMRRWGRTTSVSAVPATMESSATAASPTTTAQGSSASIAPSLRGRLRGWGEARGVMSSVRMPDLTDFWVRPALEWARECIAHDGPWDVIVSSS
ncbi:MAG: hypothetical protein KC983_08310, partial [Phycisphaerales bacterium]|nr:hypothetical protein [Phycisphaerales bacterium]